MSLTIERLFLLRYGLVHNLDVGFGESTLSHLVEIRKKGLSSRCDVKTFISLCYEVWKALSTIDVHSFFYLPPPYLNESIKKISDAVFSKIWRMERDILPVGSNLVLQGLKGVGKTTLLQSFAAITAVLSNVLPLYWIFEKEYVSVDQSARLASPYLLYYLAVKELYQANHMDVSTVSETPLLEKKLAQLKQNSINYHSFYEQSLRQKETETEKPFKCLFLLDEFTTLYQLEHAEVGVAIISEFKKIARFGDTFFVLAASCCNVQKYLFREQRDLSGATSPASSTSLLMSYPDLNCSLFVVQEVKPLRKSHEIVAYFHDRYRETISEIAAEQIFHYTGGIGRDIHDYRANGAYFIERYPNVSSLLVTKAAQVTFQRLVLSPIPVASKLQFADRESFDTWMDSLILYEEDGQVTFLCPALREKFKDVFDSDARLQAAFCFKMQRIGFEGGSTGHSNEAFLCKYLNRLKELEVLSPLQFELAIFSSNGYRFKMYDEEKKLILPSPPSPSPDPSSPPPANPFLPVPEFMSLPLSDTSDFVNRFEGHLFKWQLDGKETGLDRFWWRRGVDDTLLLFGAQIKTGRDDICYTPGCYETQSAQVKATKCDDRTIAGIIIKAEMGFNKLLPFLSRLFSAQYQISVETLFIITNKKARDAYNKYWKELKPKPIEVHEVTETRRIDGTGNVSFLRFDCRLFDGTEWLKEVIPDELLL